VDERALLVAAREGAGPARDRLVETYMPLIGSVARTYRGANAVEHAELMQEGVVGLLRALQRFDPDMGTPFWAYATWWVRQAMQQLVSELGLAVVLSDRAQRRLARLKDVQRTWRQRRGGEPSVAELARETGLSRDQVGSLFVAERRPRGLEEVVGADDGGPTYGDSIADPRAEDAFDAAPLIPVAERLPRMLDALSDRERRIVRGRYGLDGHRQTLHELGESLGVSAERIRQIEHGAIGKLRDYCGAEA
jgi:DNA-directed RNA polymerase sigma subunit (sigma70/sigma32)